MYVMNWRKYLTSSPLSLVLRKLKLGVGVYTGIVVSIAGIVSFSSSVHTPAIRRISEDLKASTLVSTLGSTTYLVGFGIGPFFFAPLAEVL